MEKITSTSELKHAIQLLEAEHTLQGELLKAHFHLTYERLKPLNLLKSTISDISSAPYLVNNIIGAITGIASGFIAKKMVIGVSKNIFRKLFGTILQFGVTSFVARHPEEIKSASQVLFEYIFRKKETSQE